jgi:hypothetical protein
MRFQVHPELNCGKVVVSCATAVSVKFMLDVIYIAVVIFVFAALALYARGCEKL